MKKSSFICFVLLLSIAEVSTCYSASAEMIGQRQESPRSAADQGFPLSDAGEHSWSREGEVEETTFDSSQQPAGQLRNLQSGNQIPSAVFLTNISYNPASTFYSDDYLTYFQQAYDSTSNQTTFQHGRIDSSLAGNILKYTYSLYGNWKNRVKSPNLGCVVAYQIDQTQYSFIAFNGSALDLRTQIFKTNLPSDLSIYHQYYLNNNTYLSQDCRFMSVNGNNYYLQDNTMTRLNMPTANYTNTTMRAYQDSIYFLASKYLYKYHFAQDYLQAQYLFPYKLANVYGWLFNSFENKFAISCQQNVSLSPLNVLTTLYIIQESPDNNFELIKILRMNANSYIQTSPIIYSPELTKVYRKYTEAPTGSPAILLKDIDYQNGTIWDVDATNTTFATFASSMQFNSSTFSLTDQFMAIRRDDMNSTFTEFVGFQFIGSTLNYIQTSPLLPLTFSPIYLFIDSTQTYNLTLNVITNLSTSLSYDQISYGIYTGEEPTQPSQQIDTPFLKLNVSPADGVVISTTKSLETLEVVYNINASQTQVTYKKISPLSVNLFDASTLTMPGNWMYFANSRSTLSCTAYYQASSQSVAFVRLVSGSLQLYQQSLLSALKGFPANLLVATNSASLLVLLSQTVLGENCNIIFLTSLYSLTAVTHTVVSLPSFGNREQPSFSPDIKYLSSYRIFEFSPKFGTYNEAYSIIGQCDLYQNFYYQNRIITVCAKIFGSTNLTNTIYAFVDYNDGEFYLLSTTSFVTSIQRLIMVSEQLTKLYVQDDSMKLCQFYSIDFNYGSIANVMLQNNHFCETSSFLIKTNQKYDNQMFYIGENYVVVRNDSASTAVPAIFYEESYQFVGDTLVLLASNLVRQKDQFQCIRTIIDQASINELSYYSYYQNNERGAGFNVYRTVVQAIAESPTPAGNWLLSLNQSLPDGLFITSEEQIQTFEVIFNPVSQASTFKLAELDETKPNSVSISSVQADGKWTTLLTASRSSLSCMLVVAPSIETYMFLSYSNQILSIYTVILKQDLPVELANLTIQQIGSNAKLGEDCGFFATNGTIFTINNINLTSTNPINNLEIARLSDSMNYFLEGNKIMKFSQQLNSYVQIYSIPGSGASFGFWNVGNRFLAYSMSSIDYTANVPAYYSLDYTFIVFVDNAWSVQTVDTFALSVLSTDPQIFVDVSAKLTKIYLQYTSPLTTQPTIIIKSVDFDNYYIFDIDFVDLLKYQETIFNLNVQALVQSNFLLDDSYLILRNDSISGPLSNCVQQGYQFLGNTLVFIGQRILSNWELGSALKISIDPFVTGQLNILDFYPKNHVVPGYYVYRNNLGVINDSNVTISLPQVPPYFIDVNNSRADNAFFSPEQSLEFFEITPRSFANYSQLTYSYLKSKQSTSLGNVSLDQIGSWSTVLITNKTLTCVLAYQSYSQTYSFFALSASNISLVSSIQKSAVPQAYLSQLSNNSKLGDNCRLLQVGSIIFYNFNYLQMAHFSSSDVKYVITSFQLFKFNETASSYSQIYTLPVWNNYEIHNHEDRLIIIGHNVVQVVPNTAIFNHKFALYVLIDSFSIVEVVDIVSFAIQTNTSSLPIFVSPNLTKIYFNYLPLRGAARVNVFKTVDYADLYVFDVDVLSQASLDIIASLQELNKTNFVLGDQYLIVRNDTSANVLANAANPANLLIEAGFQFVNTSLVTTYLRVLQSFEGNKCNRIFINQTLGDLLSYDFIAKTRIVPGYYLNQTISKAYSGASLPSSIFSTSIFAETSLTQGSNTFKISNSTASLQYWANTTSTCLRYIFLDRSQAANTNSQLFTMDGTWQLLSSSVKLTCNLLTFNNTFVFLYYNGTSFELIGPFDNIFNTLTMPFDIFATDDCRLFSANNIFYVIENNTIMTVVTNTTLSPTLPHTDSFDYVIRGTQLFALSFDEIQYAFNPVFSSIPSGSNCKIKSYDIIVLAVCSVAKSLNNTTVGVDVTIFMWADFSPLTLVSNQTYSYVAGNGQVSISISPSLTKVFYSYTTPTKTLTPVLKNVSLELGTFTDLNFVNQITFNSTAAIWSNRFNQSNFHLTDRFLVIRNDSYIATTTNAVFAEQAYYFNQTDVAILGTRVLSNGQLFKCQNIFVDQTINDKLSLLISYPKYRLSSGYRFYEMSYGSNLTISSIDNTNSTNSTNSTNNTSSNITNSTATTQTVNGLTISSTVQILPPPSVTTSVIATFYNSTLQNQFIESKELESLQVNQGANITNIILSYLDRNSNTNVTSISTTLSGLWSLYARSTDTLSCLVFADSPLSSFTFLRFSYTDNAFYTINTISLSAFLPYANLSWYVGEDCNLARADNSVFNLLKSTATGLKKVVTPSSWQVAQHSSSLIYVIAAQILYEFDSIANTFQQIASLLAFQNYNLANFQSRLLITGYNSTLNTSGTFTSERVWVMVDGNILDFFDIKATGSVNIATSPELTKIYCEYTSSNGSTVVVVKSVDYSANVITDYFFTDLTHYLETIKGISQFDAAHFAVGQYYLTVRNDTIINSNNSFEEAYEYVGTSIMLLRSRSLSGLEVGTSYRMVIDDFYQNQLIIVDYYPVFNPSALVVGYSLNAFGYGNMATTVQIATHLIPPYINFTSPIFSQSSSSLTNFQWTYLYTNILTHTTTFMIFTSVDNNATNIVNNNFTIAGLWRLVAESSACKLVQNKVSNDYYLYRYRITSNLFTVVSNVTAIINNIVSNTTSWKFSQDCSRIVGQDYYLVVANSINTSSLINSSWVAVDSTSTYAYDSSGIWKYSAGSNIFMLYRSGSLNGLTSNAVIIASGSALVIYSTANQAAYFYAFSNNGSALSLVFSQGLTDFVADPTISVSSSLINLVIYGSNGQTVVLGYFINYSTKSYQNITIPQTDIISIAKTIILIEDSWLYIRQLTNTSNATNGNLQLIYAIQQSVIPVLIKTQNISDYDSVNWIRTKLLQLSNGNIKALTQVTSSTRLVLRLQIAAVQSSAGTKPMDGMNTVVVDGLIRLCKPGCDECSQGVCYSCLSGYVYSSNTKACLPCGVNCKACSKNNLNNCSVCVDGSYLNGSICLNCDPSCSTCAGSATSCKQCLPRYYFNITASSCQVCPRNCLSCNSSGYCLSCAKGFTQFNGTCRGCSISCSDCSPLNIMSCTSCANGLELIDQACVSCPLNCAVCKNGKCGVCVSGYRPNTNGQCYKNCDFPCANCSDSSPSLCASCYYGWIINGTTCRFDLSCNSTYNCSDCGVGTGYFLVGASCLKCGTISNCLQCAEINSQLCAICLAGYYLKDNICVACPSICSTCVGALSCTSCITGYTLVGSNDQSQCLACQSPCLTCQNFRTYCTSCITGYSKIGWKCQVNINVGFRITLSTDVPTLLASVDVLVRDLLKLLGKSTDEVDAITFSSFVAGSAVVSGFGSVGGSASTTVAATSSLSSGLSGSSVGGFSITSSSVVTNGVDSGQNTNINMTLVIGLCLGIPLFIVAIGLVLYCMKKEKDLQIKPQSQSQHYDTKDKHERSENIMLSNSINQKDLMSMIKEESLSQSQVEDYIIDRGPNYREIKFPFARVEECGSMQDIKGDSDVQEAALKNPKNNQKQKENKFELEIEDIGESVQSEMQRSQCPVVMAPFKVDKLLKVEEVEIEQCDTFYLQPQRRSKKRKSKPVSQVKNDQVTNQDSNHLLSSNESPAPQSIIFVEPEDKDHSTEMKYSKPPNNLGMHLQQFSIENESISQEKESQAQSKSSRFNENPSTAQLKVESYLSKQKMQALPSQLLFYLEQSN